jgi:predicted nuclease with TOPRIM domain
MVVTIVFSSNLFFTEMRNMQSAVREHTRRVFQETEELRNQLVEKESNIQRRSRELNELVAQTDMERRKLEEERKKVRVNPHSYWWRYYCFFCTRLLYHCHISESS